MPDVQEITAPSEHTLEFLWLELTNKCNLNCVHCYAESGPHVDGKDGMSYDEYCHLLDEAYEIGCRQVQFIGGEPTLNRDLPQLVRYAAEAGYEFIEIYSNLTRVPSELLDAIQKYNVHIATSVYSDDALIHDEITAVPGSFNRTIGNIQRLIPLGVPVRVGFVEMTTNKDEFENVRSFLKDLRVENVGYDRLRNFGRAETNECNSGMGELCGKCADRIACVSPDGVVTPCIMSKRWSVGNVRTQNLREIVRSDALISLRRQISEATNISNSPQNACDPGVCNPCNPNRTCPPSLSNCPPTQCGPYCSPRKR